MKNLSLKAILVWSIASMFFFYEFLLRTYVGTLSNSIIKDLHLTASKFAFLGSVYYIAYGFMQIPVGIIVDKIGIRFSLIFSATLCGISVFIFSQSQDFGTALLARFIMGFGSSFAFICLLAIVVKEFPKQYFGFLGGLSQFIGTLGPLAASGPLLTWLQTHDYTWRHFSFFLCYLAAIFVFLFFILIRNSNKKNLEIITVKAKVPLSQEILSLFKNSQVWYIAIYSGFLYFSMEFIGAVWGMTFLTAKGLEPNNGAYLISIAWLGFAIGCPLLGAYSDWLNRRKTVMILCAFLSIVCLLLMGASNLKQHYLFAILIFAAFGVASTGQNLGFAAIAEQVKNTIKGTALGFNNAFITLTGAIFSPLFSKIFEVMQNPGSSSTQMFSPTWLLALLPFIALIISTLFVKETFCKSQKDMMFVESDTITYTKYEKS